MRHLGRFGVAPSLRSARVSRTVFVLAMVIVSGGALIGATGAAADTTVSETSQFMYDGTNPCTGEAFSGTGNLHFDESENLSTSLATQYHLNVRIDGLQAVTVTGKKYVAQDTLNHEFVFSGADEDTYDATAHFIRVGEDGTLVLGDDFYEYFRAHITTNAAGMITAFDIRTNDMPCQ